MKYKVKDILKTIINGLNNKIDYNKEGIYFQGYINNNHIVLATLRDSSFIDFLSNNNDLKIIERYQTFLYIDRNTYEIRDEFKDIIQYYDEFKDYEFNEFEDDDKDRIIKLYEYLKIEKLKKEFEKELNDKTDKKKVSKI